MRHDGLHYLKPEDNIIVQDRVHGTAGAMVVLGQRGSEVRVAVSFLEAERLHERLGDWLKANAPKPALMTAVPVTPVAQHVLAVVSASRGKIS